MHRAWVRRDFGLCTSEPIGIGRIADNRRSNYLSINTQTLDFNTKNYTWVDRRHVVLNRKTVSVLLGEPNWFRITVFFLCLSCIIRIPRFGAGPFTKVNDAQITGSRITRFKNIITGGINLFTRHCNAHFHGSEAHFVIVGRY